jgi:hypothetical protein
LIKITTRVASSSILLASIFLSFGLTGILPYIGFINNVYAQNSWYLGQGAKPDTYYTYKIQEHDTKQGQPYIMSIYFKSYNNTGNYWIAPTYVVYQGKVYNGTLHLSSLDLTALGSSKIPQDMQPFISGYKDSIAWLSSFVPKPGL